jgi:uncharacterized phage protein (TIGR02220 family)
MGDWIKLHRKVSDWEWYKDGNTARLFLHCLIRAEYENIIDRGILIERGSFRTKLEELSTELDITIQQIRTSLARLEKSETIIINSTNKYTIITVVKYEDYQKRDTSDNNQITNEQQTNNTQKPFTKVYIEEEKNKKILSFPFLEIVTYLNEKAHKSFRHNIATTQKRICARFSEGFRLEDFKKVIDNKVADWKDDPKMNEYLRPETLFGTKFESYLNSKPESTDKVEQVWTEEKRKRAQEIMGEQ